jgi:hypothetical protein
MQVDIWSINHVKDHKPTGVYSGMTREFVIGRDDVDPLPKSYCDMGAPYTAWKYMAVPPIIGFHGYRKHIVFDARVPLGWYEATLPSFQAYQSWLAQQRSSFFTKLLSTADVLTVTPFNCSYNHGMAKDYCISRSEEDWNALQSVMEKHGDFNFDTPFIRPMHFVCRDHVFLRWMRFWDKVRKELEPLVLSKDAVTPEYPQRAMAFLSERIWSLWLDSTGLLVQEFPLLISWDSQ